MPGPRIPCFASPVIPSLHTLRWEELRYLTTRKGQRLLEWIEKNIGADPYPETGESDETYDLEASMFETTARRDYETMERTAVEESGLTVRQACSKLLAFSIDSFDDSPLSLGSLLQPASPVETGSYHFLLSVSSC